MSHSSHPRCYRTYTVRQWSVQVRGKAEGATAESATAEKRGCRKARLPNGADANTAKAPALKCGKRRRGSKASSPCWFRFSTARCQRRQGVAPSGSRAVWESRRLPGVAPSGSRAVWQSRRLAVAPSGSRAVWESRRLGVAPSGSRAVRESRRLAVAPFGIRAVWHSRRLAFAPSGSRAVWQSRRLAVAPSGSRLVASGRWPQAPTRDAVQEARVLHLLPRLVAPLHVLRGIGIDLVRRRVVVPRHRLDLRARPGSRAAWRTCSTSAS